MLCVGSIEGESGASLKINVAGEKVGWWKDWATDEKGGTNLVSLWAKRRKITFYRALAEVKAWLDARAESGGDFGPASVPVAPTKPPTAPSSAKVEKPFDWKKCLQKTNLGCLTRLCDERRYSTDFMYWLHVDQKLIGCYGNSIAFPVHNDEGTVVGIHVHDAKRRSWRYVGRCSTHPLIIGDLAKAKVVILCESQWDAFSIYDLLGLKDRPGYAAFITRSAQNGKFVEGKMPKDAKLLAFRQNDQPDSKGRVPAEEWLKAVALHAGAPVYLVKTPASIKDPNDWAKAGATKEDIERAVGEAEVVDLPSPLSPNASKAANADAALGPKPLPDCYYEPLRGLGWFMPDGKGAYIEVTESGVSRYLRSIGYSSRRGDDELISPLEDVLMRLQQQHNVAYAGSLAGYRVGVYAVQGGTILVTSSPVFIKPAEGDWPVLGELLDNMLVDAAGEQQAYLFGWLKVDIEALHGGVRRPGQGLVLAGPADCGKSLLQNLITIILGGRSAKPYSFMTGVTAFNRDLFVAEHLMVEDEVPSSDFRSRRNFGTNIKGVTVNATQRLHQKNRDAITLEPFWRLTISLNDETENLQVLPPIDPSILDKLILLKVHKKPMPMPTGTIAERNLFWETLVAELPAFLHWLSEWEIPREIRSERYGVTHFHHPEILQAVDELAPEARLLDLIDDKLFLFGAVGNTPWSGTARQLEDKLLEVCGGQVHEVRRLLSFNTACGTYLARLEQKYPIRITSRTVRGYRIWKIDPPEELPTIAEGTDDEP